MEDTGTLTAEDGTPIAFRRIAGRGPGIIFLGGFKSDMTGSKAEALSDWAAAKGQAFCRFDYAGHGQSGGRFEDGTIGRWAADAQMVLDQLTTARRCWWAVPWAVGSQPSSPAPRPGGCMPCSASPPHRISPKH